MTGPGSLFSSLRAKNDLPPGYEIRVRNGSRLGADSTYELARPGAIMPFCGSDSLRTLRKVAWRDFKNPPGRLVERG